MENSLSEKTITKLCITWVACAMLNCAGLWIQNQKEKAPAKQEPIPTSVLDLLVPGFPELELPAPEAEKQLWKI